MNTLIYTVAYGDPVFLEMAQNLRASAFSQGYTGSFLIVRDEHCLPGMPKAGLLRALEREQVESFEQILFVDADCLFTRNPEALFEGEGLRLLITGTQLSAYNGLFLNEKEKAAAVDDLNSGTFVVPGTQAHDFLSAWEAIWLASPREALRRLPKYSWIPSGLMDQPALQALVIRTGIAYSPLAGVRFPEYNTPEELESGALLHFCGDIKVGNHLRNKLDMWQRIQEYASKSPAPPGRSVNGPGREKPNLVYSFCFGSDAYFFMAQEMIDSVRRQGFEGDILILTDRPWTFRGATSKWMRLSRKRLWKCSLLDVLSPEDYEKILYLDTDIICVAPLDWAFRYEGITVATASTLLHASPGTAHCLNREARRAVETLGIYGVNTGAILYPGSVAREFLTRWETVWGKVDKAQVAHLWDKKTNHQLLDESVLQVMMMDRIFPIELFPQEKMLFPVLTTVPGYSGVKLSARTAWIHFLSTSTDVNSKEEILGAMKACRDPEGVESVVRDFEERSRQLSSRGRPDESFSDSLHHFKGALEDILQRLESIERRLA